MASPAAKPPTPQELLDRLANAETSYKELGKVVKQLRDVVGAAGGKAPKPQLSDEEKYQAAKAKIIERKRREVRASQDIGELPEPKDPERKARCKTSLRDFCETYHAADFSIRWSADHLGVIAKIERAVIEGGLFSMAMPRGSGKTTLCRSAVEWALLYGHRRFVAFIGAEATSAKESLDAMRMSLETNDLLLDDFPEVVLPIRRLEGVLQKTLRYKGDEIRMEFCADMIVLPNLPGSAAAGAMARFAGITGRIRGMNYKRFDGQTARPDLVILDDPQTDESARSPSQCVSREQVINGAVLGLAGPRRKIAGLMPCTVIRQGDLADNLLSKEKHPEWNGERTKMVNAFPTNDALWMKYAQIRAESLKLWGDIHLATEFYQSNREAMDAGASVAWPERFNHDEASALQHAMNLRLSDEASFFAEYQNEPLPERKDDVNELTADQIAGKINRLPRFRVPLGCDHVTAFIDIQANMLFYAVAAWRDDFTGHVIDYGSWPEQGRHYYTTADARNTYDTAKPGAGLEGQIYFALEQLVAQLADKEWVRDDGATVRLERCLIDANWGLSTDTVYQFCRQSSSAALVMPSHGRFVGASSQPFSEYKRTAGERTGHNWRVPNVQGKRTIRHVLFDANYWKSFVHGRLRVAMGDPGCLSLFGESPVLHRLFADHLTAEYRIRTEGRGRQVDEWKARPDRRDNHWLDCLAGCAVAASMQGCALPDSFTASTRSTRRKAEIPAHMRRR